MVFDLNLGGGKSKGEQLDLNLSYRPKPSSTKRPNYSPLAFFRNF
ncbi:hypothetical protein CWATWH0005_3838 [Crocosphaera watsonii WH 0005]|uniref:Uncharacterized protein n=1 Tax=Crocosphaera watsonii WH 0005 TaxID=423472 RepID=T2IV38_CROWT|nr:hypothetical protein CWATWH0005_3838 [Crocosphaera watsonii WH 0005]